MALVIRGSKIFDLDKSPNEPLDALSFFNLYKYSTSELNLNLLGFGALSFYVFFEDENIKLKIELKSEVGNFYLNELDFDLDYIIRDNYWIPLEAYELLNIKDILNELDITLNQSITLGKVYSLISKANESNISFVLDEKIFEYKPSTSLEIDKKLNFPLYPYQKYGVSWLNSLFLQGIGGLLCDEMGLGKTAQIIGLISQIRIKNDAKVLIISPASLTINWLREFEKFLPSYKVYGHFGPNRTFDRNNISKEKIIITSYDLLLRDKYLLSQQEWDLVICDEAQVLKNRKSQRHNAVLDLNSKCKILVTGTPVENSLRDMWALSRIIKPGVLGTYSYFETLIENNSFLAKKVSKHLAPLILRREVKDVMSELPELIEIEEPLIGTPIFNEFYEMARSGGSETQDQTSILALITSLMQICCYPKLVDNSYSDPGDSKIVRLLQLLEDIKARRNEKVIIFSTYRKSLDLISQIIRYQLNNPYVEIIDGRLAQVDRFSVLDEFEKIEGFAVLCINPSAGGVGLNITSANHVIHFNRQWNPALERQATARSYRRGQDKPVFVYKLYYLGTIEEIINDRLRDKEIIASETLSMAVQEGEDKDIKKAIMISPISEKL